MKDSCEYQPECPGCPRYSEPGLSADAQAKLVAVARAWGSESPAEEVCCEGLGARHRARLSVRGRAGKLGIGIFERGSHRLVSIPRCGVHHPAIGAFLPRLLNAVNEAGVTGYDERTHTGCLRAVQLAVEPPTGKLQLVLLINHPLGDEPLPGELLRACERLKEEEGLQGLFLGALPHRGNSLVAERFERLSGASMLMDRSGGAKVFFPPGAFGQANPVLHDEVARRIASFVEPDARVVEYYAGVGTLGLGLAAKGCEVSFNEVGEGSIDGLRAGWSDIFPNGKLRLFAGPAGEHAELYGRQDVVLVDPPRKGLDEKLLVRLTEEPPRKLIYLSCGIDALIRESAALARSGRLKLEHLSGWTYFPFTDHVETLLIASRMSEDEIVETQSSL